MTTLTYLASPYSHEDGRVRARRYQAAVAAVAAFMNRGEHVFSPIVHSYPVAIAHSLPGEWEFWAEYDECMVSRCDRLVVLQLEGWDNSRGIAAEVAIAERLGIPVIYKKAGEL